MPEPSPLLAPAAFNCLDDLYRIRCLCPGACLKILPLAVILNRFANAFLVFCIEILSYSPQSTIQKSPAVNKNNKISQGLTDFGNRELKEKRQILVALFGRF
jgi:hypothetical protein